MKSEGQEAVSAIRSAYITAGSKKGVICTSETCLNLARRRVFWPSLEGEEFPVYCLECADWAKTVLTAIGCLYADEPVNAVQVEDGGERAIELES